MVELEPIHPSASAPPRTTNRTDSTMASSNRPVRQPLDRVYTAQHLDDHSLYHLDHTDSFEDDVTEADNSEILSEEEDEEAREKGIEEGMDVRMGVVNEKDLEKGDRALEKKKSSKSIRDPDIVTWDGPNDPENPKNWTKKQKWAATFVVSSFTFISPVSSSMVAPAISSISKEFNITNEVEQQLVLSVFVLAYAIGPLFLGPLSEIYGRVPVLQISNLFYLVFNIACGFSRNKGEMIAFRFLSGLGGSAPLAVSHFRRRTEEYID